MRWNHHLMTGWTALKGGAVHSVAALALGGLFVGAAVADDVVFSQDARFRIPYKLDAAEIQRLKASEIQLHVSTDGGAQWRHVDSVPPVEGKFTFEATKDGEYWFSVRTVGSDGQRHPAGPLTAGLKVFVDTAAPTLSVQVSQAAAGQVGLRWSAADDHLDPESLVLEFRTDGGEWEAIHIVPTAAGETMWSVPSGGTVTVRGKVQDLAGNQGIQQSEAQVSGEAPPPQERATPGVRRPIADGQPEVSAPVTPDPFAQLAPSQIVPNAQPRPTVGMPAIHPQGAEQNHLVSQPGTTPTPAQEAPWETTVPQPLSPQPAAAPQQPAASQLPIRRVNSTTFQIGYALDDVGPSGVSSVDLYLTEDNGQQWFHFGADADSVSPFEVTVPQDGTYGFAIRVKSGVGLAQSPPQPGDLPEVMVAVDRQPPQVTLLPLKQGQGQQPSQLLIEWTMSADDLAERPVSLYYAPRQSGPWQPITGWEPNTGQYLWTFGPDAPKQVYIRLDARDTAGNIARVESQEPLLIDLARPTARIIDVESVSIRH